MLTSFAIAVLFLLLTIPLGLLRLTVLARLSVLAGSIAIVVGSALALPQSQQAAVLWSLSAEQVSWMLQPAAAWLLFFGALATVAAFLSPCRARRPALWYAGAAVALPALARRSVDAGLSGLEWAVGVPGSVGGAVRMNAGGHGADVARSLRNATVFDLNAKSGERIVRKEASDLDLGYRTSSVHTAEVVIEASFTLREGDPVAGRDRIAEIVRWRRANQPGGQNAGSVFQNPEGSSAGSLIEDAGLKGFRVGTASVSTKHANFIQADEGGSADDVARLIGMVRRRVLERFSVELRTEVKMIGFAEL